MCEFVFPSSFWVALMLRFWRPWWESQEAYSPRKPGMHQEQPPARRECRPRRQMGTPQGCRGPWGGDTAPSTRSPGRKEMEEGRSLFPATSVSMASPAPCRPCREEVDPGAGPGGTPGPRGPRGCSLSLERTGGSVPLLRRAPGSGNSRFLSLSFPFSILDVKQSIIKIVQGLHSTISATQKSEKKKKKRRGRQ